MSAATSTIKKESRREKKKRLAKELACLAEFDANNIKQDVDFVNKRQKERSKLKRLVKLSDHLQRYIGSFLCWFDNYAMSRVCRGLVNGCRPFENDLCEFLTRTTGLETKNIKAAVAQGLCFSGSILKQIGYAVHFSLVNESHLTNELSSGDEKYSDRERKMHREKLNCTIPWSKRKPIETDIDLYFINSWLQPGNMTTGSRGDDNVDPTRLLVPDDPKFETLDKYRESGSDEMKRRNYIVDPFEHFEDTSYENYLPLHCAKYCAFEPRTVLKLAELDKLSGLDSKLNTDDLSISGRRCVQENRQEEHMNKSQTDAKTKTILEFVGIKYQKTVSEFLDKFVDQSDCLLYFGLDVDWSNEKTSTNFHPSDDDDILLTNDQEKKKTKEKIPKLHWKNMHHIWDRSFKMRWDLDRYMKSRSHLGGGPNKKVKQKDSAFIRQMSSRLLGRCDKSIERGFTCLNPKNWIQRSDYCDEETARLIPPDKKSTATKTIAKNKKKDTYYGPDYDDYGYFDEEEDGYFDDDY